MSALTSVPPQTEPEAAAVTRVTWAQVAPVTWQSFLDVPSSNHAHEPWVPAPLLPRVVPVLRAAGLAAVAGVVGGVATSYVESRVGSPIWSSSFAPWAAIAAGVAFAVRGPWKVAAMAGVLTQLGLVLGFCLSQPAFSGTALSGQTVMTYVVAALVAGPFCGAAPGFVRDRCLVARTMGLAIVSAPWVAEGVWMMASALGHDHLIVARLVVGATVLAAGIALPLVINGSPRDSLRNLGVVAGLGLFLVVALLLFPMEAGGDGPSDLARPGLGLLVVSRGPV